TTATRLDLERRGLEHAKINKSSTLARLSRTCLCAVGFSLISSAPLIAQRSNEPAIAIAEENAKAARVRPGKPFLIKLPVQLGTGFSWKITQAPKQLSVVSKTVETPQDTRPGGEEYQVFQLLLKFPEETDVVFSLSQPFDPDGGAAQRVQVHLIVSDP